ncbi:sporulation protein [Nocardiopsis sp. CNT-189]|uniref:sporulation protein n=1 Tax=Nocardiopsis oceanisediminis TaxID=2816862 RepID=UPI003B3669E8
MVFKRFLAAFGVGGPSIDTVLANPHVQPGGVLEGHVELHGGDVDARIGEIAVALATRAEVEVGDGEAAAGVEFARIPVSGPLRLEAGERRSLPFRYPVPWQAPLTEAGGAPLPGAVLGLRTEVVIDGAPDKGDLDRVHVHPLPVQDGVLEALARLGFGLKHTDVEHGHLGGTRQEFPLFQEIEYYASPEYAHEVNEIELSFVADEHGMDVVIEFDRRGGVFGGGGDAYGLFRVEHAQAHGTDWTALVADWIGQALDRHRSLFGGHRHYGHHGDHGDDHGGGMMGAVGGAALGMAGGLAAGYVAAEVIDEVFEEEEPEEEEEE